jgi:hypothetical protein
MKAAVHKIADEPRVDVLGEMVLGATGFEFSDYLALYPDYIFNTTRSGEPFPEALETNISITLAQLDIAKLDIKISDFNEHDIVETLNLNLCPWEVSIKLLTQATSLLKLGVLYYVPVMTVSQDGSVVQGTFVLGAKSQYISQVWLDKKYHLDFGHKGSESQLIYML